MIVIVRQILGVMRFVAELPKALNQLGERARANVVRELGKLLVLVEKFKEATPRSGAKMTRRRCSCTVGYTECTVGCTAR